MFRLGILINPIAGLGGPAGLKGSDHIDTPAIARERGVESKVHARVFEMLSELLPFQKDIELIVASGDMGLNAVQLDGWAHQVLFESPQSSSAEDSVRFASMLHAHSVDLLLFAGGDGTARDVCRAVGETQAVLGLPAGVKMHSGVFAVTPKAAASLIMNLIKGSLVAARLSEVRDIDEAAFAQGRVSTRYFGEMLVPDDQLLVQSVKCTGLQDDDLMLDELSAYVVEQFDDETLYILGSGGTMKRIKETVGINDGSLLGVDVWFQGETLALDVHEAQLFELIQGFSQLKLILSIIGGQGVVLGRGNQQISPRVIETVGVDNLMFVSTQQKIQELGGQPLHIDSGSDALDAALSGHHKIICGYEDAILYPIQYIRSNISEP